MGKPLATINPVIVIPARMAATRLPGKPLADIGGVPMIVRVLRQAEASGVGPVIVAAGDQEIVDVVEAAGGEAVLTDPDLRSGTDRVYETLLKIDPAEEFDVVINVQGDMPFIDPEYIRLLAAKFEEQPQQEMVTLVAPVTTEAEKTNPDVVKAILSLARDADFGRALYFTRSTLYGEGPVYKHIGIYGYRRQALEEFTVCPELPLEKREKLEQLRAMELGVEIWAAIVASPPISVDSPADLEAARKKAAN